MKLTKLGVWFLTDGMTAAAVAAFARRVETWGYGVLWIAEPPYGRDVLAQSSWLLANTTRLIVATGIASIYARDAMTMRGGQLELAEQSAGRFLLGLGVSHANTVEESRGQHYGRPVTTMRAYLEAMDGMPSISPAPAERPPRMLAALGPKMLALSAEMADGAHPYLTTPDHTERARRMLGPGKWLCPEQKVLLETDPAEARRKIRAAVRGYAQPNYRKNLISLGFDETDFAGGGSDRLVDALVAWGDEEAIRRRIQEHWDAGADHVCIQPISEGTWPYPAADERVLELLAPSRG